MLNQSFRKVFVTNSPTLLASGSTVENIGVGQIAIVDGKSYAATTTPTYAKNKALYIVQGTADLSQGPLMDGLYDQNNYSKLIVGKRITGFRGKSAKRGQTQQIAIGFSGGISDTDTISANLGEKRHLYLTLTGGPIDKLFTTQGITRHYIQDYPVQGDCDDVCAEVDRVKVAKDFILQINSDTMINRFVKASLLTSCTPNAFSLGSSTTVYVFELRIADSQDDTALGAVQVQYPNDIVARVGTEGVLSVYQIQRATNSTPTAFAGQTTVVIPNCDTCPSGYTEHPAGFVYIVKRADAGSSGNLTTVKSDYGISSTGESGTRVNYEYGTSTYVLISATEISSAISVDELDFIADSKATCVLDSSTTTAWAAGTNLVQYGKSYTITLGDTSCGDDRLTELQAAYPDLTVALVNAGGTCVHTYSTTVKSNVVSTGCSVDLVSWVKPPSFEGVQWVADADTNTPDSSTCLVGIKLEIAFVNRLTTECTYDYFPYEMDTIHVSASTFDPYYNDSPFSNADWVVKQIRPVQFPAGFGAHIRIDEQKSLSYDLRERSFDPVVREQQHYQFQAVSTQYYDEYVIEYEFSVIVGGWGQKEIYKYQQVVFFPEGQGKNFENAINGYLASAAIQVDPVVL